MCLPRLIPLVFGLPKGIRWLATIVGLGLQKSLPCFSLAFVFSRSSLDEIMVHVRRDGIRNVRMEQDAGKRPSSDGSRGFVERWNASVIDFVRILETLGLEVYPGRSKPSFPSPGERVVDRVGIREEHGCPFPSPSTSYHPWCLHDVRHEAFRSECNPGRRAIGKRIVPWLRTSKRKGEAGEKDSRPRNRTGRASHRLSLSSSSSCCANERIPMPSHEVSMHENGIGIPEGLGEVDVCVFGILSP